MGTLPAMPTDRILIRKVSWEGLEVRMIRRPFMTASVRDKLLLLLIKALMGASSTAGF
jgi:hypothetical protein